MLSIYASILLILTNTVELFRDEAEPKEHARTLLESDHDLEAAREFENLWHEQPDEPSWLFQAAVSRNAAGHHAHTVEYMREYLAQADLGSDERKQGEELLDESLRKITLVTAMVELPPEGSPIATIVARYHAQKAEDERPELLFPVVSPQPMTLPLDPGIWILRVEGPTYQPTEQLITVATTPIAVSLQASLLMETKGLQPREVPSRVIRKTTLGLHISGGVVAATGIGLVGGGVGMINNARNCNDPTLALCRRNFAYGLAVRNAGLTVLGGGAGLIAGALVWQSERPRQRMIAWSTLAALGGASILAGQVLLLQSTIPFNRDNTNPVGTLDDWGDHWQKHHHSVGPAFASTLRGLGAGLLVGAVTGLIVQRKYLGPGGARKVRVAPDSNLGYTGIVVLGRF